MVTAFYTDSDSEIHTLPGHPEHAGRLQAVLAHLDSTGLRSKLEQIEAIPVTDEDLQRVHRADYLRLLERISAMSDPVMLDADTYLLPESYAIARQTVGGVCAVGTAIVSDQAQNGLVTARPPGHHATPYHGMGFCLLNNVALAARYIQANHPEIERIAIVDFDVHHGNGTQDSFLDDPSVLFISSHQYGIYPGTGRFQEMGVLDGQGYTLNLPLSAKTGDAHVQALYETVVKEALHQYKPQFMIISAGFDAHWRDPLANIQLSLTGLATISQLLYDTAQEVCNGKLMFVMEGGYDLEVLAHGIENVAHVLLGEEIINDPLGPGPSKPLDEHSIQEIKEKHLLFQQNS